MVWISIALLLIGVYVTRHLFRHLHEAKLLRLREIVHAERRSALDNSIELPESRTREIEAALSDDLRGMRIGSQGGEIRWVRVSALVLGLVGLFSGIGAGIGLYLVPDADVQGTWPLGFIPFFIGLGLLLFVLLSRGVAASSDGGEESS